MKNRTIAIAGFAGVLLIGGVVAGGTMATASDPPDFSKLHGEQARAAASVDKLPDTLLESDQSASFRQETARHISESARASYWSVLKDDGDLCLIVQPAASDVVGGTCTSAENFAKHGMVFSMSNPDSPDTSFAAYLLPDSAAEAKTPRGMQRAASNILEVPMPDGYVKATEIAGAAGTVSLREIAAPPK